MKYFKKEILPYIPAYIIAGFIMAFGAAMLHSAQAVTGGVPGLGLILSYITELTPGTWVIILNVPILIFGYFVKGINYCIRVIVCMFILAINIDLNIYLFSDFLSQFNHYIVSFLSGICGGLGGIYFIKKKGNSGGTLILCQIISESTKISIGYVMLVIDLAISLLGVFVVLTWSEWLYSILAIFSMAVTSHYFNKR